MLRHLFSPQYSTVMPPAAALGSHPDMASPYAGMAEWSTKPDVALPSAAAGGKSFMFPGQTFLRGPPCTV